MSRSAESRGSTSKAKRALFVAGMLLVPLLFFGLAEVGLRAAGFGDGYPLFVEVPGHPTYLHPNPDVGHRYFSRTSLVPAPPHDPFSAEKKEDTYRIFVQGASTAAGFPYGHGGSFSRMLLQRLQRTFPARSIEVVNTSMAAVNSYTLLDLSPELIAQQPDAVLVYAGHNEFYGALGVGSTESIGPMRTLIRWYLAIDHFRLVQALHRGWTRLLAGSPTGRAPGATLMEEMARERSISLESPLYRGGMDQLESNLTSLLCRYRDAGIPAFIGTIASNERDMPPFDSGLAAATDPQQWQAAWAHATSLVEQGDSAAALVAFSELIRIDGTSAAAYFARARLLDAAGRFGEARADYLAAKDHDRLRFRATEEANSVIRRAASACGARVVDTRAALAKESPGGIIGLNRMLEHLHPNVDGYFIISDAFYNALRDAGQIGSWENAVPRDVARATVLVTPLDTTLASYHVRRLRNNWPFQPPGVTRPDTLRVEDPVETLALAVLRGQESWLSATAAAGAYFEQSGDYDEALRAALALTQEEPYRDQPYLLAGNLLVKQGRYAAAFQYFQAAETRRPSAEARHMMGHALLRGGRPAEAVHYLQQSLVLDGNAEGALFDLAVAFAESGRYYDARGTAERLMRENPDSERGRHLLARLADERADK